MAQTNGTKQENVFIFPPIVTKAELTTFYKVSADKLKAFLGNELSEELNWTSTRTFGPEQSNLIYTKLSPAVYPRVIEARIKIIVEASINNMKQVA